MLHWSLHTIVAYIVEPFYKPIYLKCITNILENQLLFNFQLVEVQHGADSKKWTFFISIKTMYQPTQNLANYTTFYHGEKLSKKYRSWTMMAKFHFFLADDPRNRHQRIPQRGKKIDQQKRIESFLLKECVKWSHRKATSKPNVRRAAKREYMDLEKIRGWVQSFRKKVQNKQPVMLEIPLRNNQTPKKVQ